MSEIAGRQVFGADEIVELGRFGSEAEFDCTDRAVPLLGDDDFAEPVHLFEPLSPLLVALAVLVFRFVRAAGRLA